MDPERERPATALRARRSPSAVLLSAVRVRQWPKNGLVALAPLAAGSVQRSALPVCGAFAAFCLLSSATYLVNDVRDRERDRRHPRKRHRPVAAGEMAPHGALRIAAMLAASGLALSVVVRPLLGAVALSYLALTTSYSLWWRSIAIADILACAMGFVMRAVAGGVAGRVPVSVAFLIVTFASAVFVIAGKRYAELARSSRARATLEQYTPVMLQWILLAAATTACAAYTGWALRRAELGAVSAMTLAPFALWLGRYSLLLRGGEGESPEELILRDPGLLALAAAWVLLFLAGAHGAG